MARTSLARASAPHARASTLGEVDRWGSLVGGSALVLYGLARRSVGGALLSLVGGGLVYRGARAGVRVRERAPGVRVERAMTINRAIEEVYAFWRRLENLPGFMRHLVSVTSVGGRRSHWVARAPAGRTVEWDAEIVEEQPNERIAWRSLEPADVDHRGAVTFRRAPGGRGTEVRVRLEWDPPAGAVGTAVARLFGEAPEQQITEDLRRFKQMLETGEVATTYGQPRGAAA